MFVLYTRRRVMIVLAPLEAAVFAKNCGLIWQLQLL
jgi:hypothetical protein